MRFFILILLLFFSGQKAFSENNKILSLSEFIGYVKKYHPIVKQANLILSEGEAKLLKSRGAFDPKLGIDYNRKLFKDTKYYDKLNASFKIPTWYGIEIKGAYDHNSGKYLNPENKVPNHGLYSLGISIPLAKNLLMNERIATLKKAKLYQEQVELVNQIAVNDIIYEATLAYYQWLKYYKTLEVYSQVIKNAEERFDAVKKSCLSGDKPSIDTIEAGINLKTRKLEKEKNRITYIKAMLNLSNYLWIEDVPVELNIAMIPDIDTKNNIDNTLQINLYRENMDISSHPKIRALDNKYNSLEVEKKLRQNNLLPYIKFQYNFITDYLTKGSSYDISNYKTGLTFNFPILLRKERADLKLTKIKIEQIDLERESTKQSLHNKIIGINQEIESYYKQLRIANNIVLDYTTLFQGEEKKFEFGESSLFIVNSRETKLIQSKLKWIETEYNLLLSKSKLFNTLEQML